MKLFVVHPKDCQLNYTTKKSIKKWRKDLIKYIYLPKQFFFVNMWFTYNMAAAIVTSEDQNNDKLAQHLVEKYKILEIFECEEIYLHTDLKFTGGDS